MGKFHEMGRLIMDTHMKAGTNAHWDAFEIAYGGDDEFVFFSLDKSMSEIDTGFAEDKQFHDALGDEGMKELCELEADCIAAARIPNCSTSIQPRAIRLAEWVKADPEFWKPAMAAPADKTNRGSLKPAQVIGDELSRCTERLRDQVALRPSGFATNGAACCFAALRWKS